MEKLRVFSQFWFNSKKLFQRIATQVREHVRFFLKSMAFLCEKIFVPYGFGQNPNIFLI